MKKISWILPLIIIAIVAFFYLFQRQVIHKVADAKMDELLESFELKVFYKNEQRSLFIYLGSIHDSIPPTLFRLSQDAPFSKPQVGQFGISKRITPTWKLYDHIKVGDTLIKLGGSNKCYIRSRGSLRKYDCLMDFENIHGLNW